MSEFVYCGKPPPPIRISRKLKCIEPFIVPEVWEEVEKLKLHFDPNSEYSVDQLLSIVEKINNVRFLFE